jgi:Flp pilus assembly protein TadG
MRKRKLQAGTTTVEFAIVAVGLFLLVFAILEFSRVVFTLNLLQEGARRGARVAAVVPKDDIAIKRAALYIGKSDTEVKMLPALKNATVTTDYLDANGGTASDYASIQYVRVSISAGTLRLAVLPVVDFPLPVYSSTLPRESLGVTQ